MRRSLCSRYGIMARLPLLSAMTMAMLFAVLLAGQPARADAIRQAEDWLNTLDTLKARFIQISSDGSSAEGTLYLRRPFRSRFDYDDPNPVVLITTRTWLHVDDAEQREVVSYPVGETPIAMLLQEKVRLRGNDFSTRQQRADGVVRVILEKPDGEAAGMVILEFAEKPFALKRWTVRDATGITTTITLQNPERGLPLDAKLFVPTRY